MKIVIKLGTKLLTCADGGNLDRENIFRIVCEICEIRSNNNEIVIVSSGAIAAGCGNLGCHPSKLNLREKQAVASVGQLELMNLYREAFAKQNLTVGQILITSHDFSDRISYLNIRNTIFTLLKLQLIPIINENDTVATEEIRFGDNDYIAGVVASKIEADKFVILTDVDGLFSNDGKLIKKIKHLTADIKACAGGRGSSYGSGGMIAKIKTAENVSKHCGINTYIANGRKPGVLKKIMAGLNPGTVFIAADCSIKHKKRWIAFGLTPKGELKLDAGAVCAIIKKKSSLLAVGIKKIKGNFREGDSVVCIDEKGKEVARGLVNYSSDNLKKIMGKISSTTEKILGYKDYNEVVHRDNMVLL